MKNTHDNLPIINNAREVCDDSPQEIKRLFRKILRRAAADFGLEKTYHLRGEGYCAIRERHPDLFEYDKS